MTINLESKKYNCEPGTVASLKISGKLTQDDYRDLAPKLEGLLDKNGRTRVLVVLEDFQGWTPSAFWEYTKLGTRHIFDHSLDRMAIVGDKVWEKGIAAFTKPFTRAEVRFFPLSKAEEAQNWLGVGPNGA